MSTVQLAPQTHHQSLLSHLIQEEIAREYVGKARQLLRRRLEVQLLRHILQEVEDRVLQLLHTVHHLHRAHQQRTIRQQADHGDVAQQPRRVDFNA